MIEALQVPLEPILGPELGRWFAELDLDEGVRVRTGAMLEGARANGRVEELCLAEGQRLACDAVVVGVAPRRQPPGCAAADSILPASAPTPRRAPHSPASSPPGTPPCPSTPASAAMPAPSTGMPPPGRAPPPRAMLGEYPGIPPLPSFWSDQYGLRIQYVGHAHNADAVEIQGSPAERDFEAVFTRRGIPVAGLAVGRPRAIPALRKLIDGGRRPSKSKVKEAA